MKKLKTWQKVALMAVPMAPAFLMAAEAAHAEDFNQLTVASATSIVAHGYNFTTDIYFTMVVRLIELVIVLAAIGWGISKVVGLFGRKKTPKPKA